MYFDLIRWCNERSTLRFEETVSFGLQLGIQMGLAFGCFLLLEPLVPLHCKVHLFDQIGNFLLEK